MKERVRNRTGTQLSTGNESPNRGSTLSTGFSGGLDKPIGNTLGDRTGIGKNLTVFDPNARSPRVQQFSFDI